MSRQLIDFHFTKDEELFDKEEKVVSNTEVSKYQDFFEEYNQPKVNQSRIDLTSDKTNNMPFIMFQETGSIKNDKNKSRVPFLDKTTLSKLYFSSKNIDLVQEKIKNVVKTATENKISIDRQSDDELLIVMRSIYLQFGTNCESKVLEQVRALNDRVVKYCAQNVLSNISMYLKYLSDLKDTSRVTPYPLQTSIRGDKKGYNRTGYIGF